MSSTIIPVGHSMRRSVYGLPLCAVAVFLLLLLGTGHPNVRAQSDESVWVDPVNLSHSGAASSPAIVMQPDGRLRVFWWDQFDGVTVADETAGGWSDPLPAPIRIRVEAEQAGASGPTYEPIAAMPYIIGDAGGRAHAFWLGDPDRESGARALLHSQLPAGSTVWSAPAVVAESAVVFDVVADSSGTIHLAYLRWLHSANTPAGPYYRRSVDGGQTWSGGRSLDGSRYYRLLDAGNAYLSLGISTSGQIYVIWDEPLTGRLNFVSSSDGAATWAESRTVGGSDGKPLRGRFVAVPGGESLLLWQDARAQGMCALYQAPITGLVTGAQEGQRVLGSLTTCPVGERFFPVGDGQVLMVVSNESGSLPLYLWNGRQWFGPRELRTRFADPKSGLDVRLQSRRAILVPMVTEGDTGKAQRLVVVGADQKGDVWVLSSRETVAELASVQSASPTVSPQTGPLGPRNLSRSGVASRPAIVAQPGGAIGALWWDSLDGWMDSKATVSVSTTMSGTVEVRELREAWAESRPVPLSTRSKAAAPRFLSDAEGTIDAFWLENEGVDTGPLMYSQLAAGAAAWSTPVALVDSAARFDVVSSGRSILHVAYIRTQHTPDASAGTYYRRSTDGGAIWEAPAPLDASLYYRSLQPDDVHIRVAADDEQQVYVTWDHPHLQRAVLAASSDGGATWSAARTWGAAEDKPLRAQLAVVPGREVLALWEDGRQGSGCMLYQATAQALAAGGEGAGQRVLEGLTTCSGEAQFVPVGEGQVLLVEGSGSDTVTVAAWDGQGWSEPRRLGYHFEDPEVGKQVYLQDLHVALVADPLGAAGWPSRALVAVGSDGQGDVWVTPSSMGALDVVFAPPSPWSEPVPFSQEEGTPGLPALAADQEGNVHALWNEPGVTGQPGSGLLYARWDGQQWTRPATVLSSSVGGARDPELVAVGDRLHAVWSGGPNGQVLYSRAFLRDAYDAGGWDDARALPAPTAVGSKPDMVADVGGVLHVVYAVPVNEGRGIYYVRSDDAGANWSPVRKVFDAATAGWTLPDRPRLAVDAGGGLHVVWVRGALSADDTAQGIYYARSLDGGATWSEPFEVVSGACAWPEIAAGGAGQVRVLWSGTNQEGTWWQRGVASEVWSRAERVPGFERVSAPVMLASDGASRLVLVGLGQGDVGEPVLLQATWDGERWAEPETLHLEVREGESGVAAALLPSVGKLHVVFRGKGMVQSGEGSVQTWYTGRSVPPMTVLATPVPLLRPTATSQPLPTLQQIMSPTPDLGGASPGVTGGSARVALPVLVGGGLAAVIVASAFGARLLRSGRR